MNIVFKI